MLPQTICTSCSKNAVVDSTGVVPGADTMFSALVSFLVRRRSEGSMARPALVGFFVAFDVSSQLLLGVARTFAVLAQKASHGAKHC